MAKRRVCPAGLSMNSDVDSYDLLETESALEPGGGTVLNLWIEMLREYATSAQK
jgi:hypothetical protein